MSDVGVILKLKLKITIIQHNSLFFIYWLELSTTSCTLAGP